MQMWPETMAKGPARFVARYVVGIVFFMTLGHVVVSVWVSGPLWRDVSSAISQTVVQVMIGIGIGLSQWTHANRLYADRTGDARARYWAQDPYELSISVWCCAVLALTVVVTLVAGQMAWASGEPMLWAVTLLCTGVGALSLFAVLQIRARARSR